MPTRDDVTDIQTYYLQNKEGNRASRQQLESLVTSQVLAHYLKPKSRILELGAGAGRYTMELAALGHHVVASDFSDALLEECRVKARLEKLEPNVSYAACDARDILSKVKGPFDGILVMGPLYHLINGEERHALVENCRKLISADGVLITAHLTRLGFLAWTMRRQPQWIASVSAVEKFWLTGLVEGHPRDGGFRGYWASLEELSPLHADAGFEVLHVHGQDPCLQGDEGAFNCLPEPLKAQWAQFLFRISHDTSSIGSARHLLCVCRPK